MRLVALSIVDRIKKERKNHLHLITLLDNKGHVLHDVARVLPFHVHTFEHAPEADDKGNNIRTMSFQYATILYNAIHRAVKFQVHQFWSQTPHSVTASVAPNKEAYIVENWY